MPKVRFGRLLVAGGELIRECLGADAVVTGDEVVVGDRRIACLDRPHGL